ncbi:hypothetical protein MM221_20670 [Salipaludibacillus sp. LMS25]|uniref:hypothetical protein n=1 Tax=Salipaludibacillus sp. LMS25 TaxID=2924031 RepID=UPI0020D1E06F|nr:hypothetical protein [Salipaludibacillus sp. LMS25]UTR14920.1 hypothetical protein MM221_20670 [Salipaludibacillus sp. LMS25]
MKEKIYKKSYWRWRNKKRNLEFRYRKLKFKVDRYTNELKSGTKTNMYLLRNILIDVVKAIAFVVVLLLIDYLVNDHIRPSLNKSQLEFITEIFNFEKSTFVILVSTLASITGVFLGLYFSSIGNIIGAIYAKLPKELSLVFENEKIGNKYIRSLMRFIIVCLILLAVVSIGFETSYITSFIITLYGCISIMNFFNLGKIIYKYSDVVEVSNNIIENALRNIKLATINGVAWDDSNFQHHYYKKCSEQLKLLEMLTRTIIENEKKSENNDSLVKIFVKIFSLLYNYQYHYKGKIPSDSMWFTKTQKHKSWFSVDFSTLQTAINTASFINPEYITNEMWFEERIFKIFTNIINELLDRKDFNRVNSVLNVVAEYSEVLVSNIEVKSITSELNRITTKIHEVLLNDSENISNKMDSSINDKIGCLELITSMYVGIIIGTTKKVDKFDVEEIENFIENHVWFNKAAVNTLEFPHTLVRRVEDLRSKLVFEYELEGTVISSNWYIKQLLALEFAREIDIVSNEIVELFSNQFVKYCLKYHESKNYTASYIHVYQGVTCYSRTLQLLYQLEEKYKELEALRVEKDITWVDIDFSNLREELKENNKRLIKSMGKSILVFAFQKRSEEFPDFFGHGYNYLYEACFEALFDRDIEYFKKLYMLVVKLTLAADSKIRADLKNVSNNYYTNLMVVNSSYDFMALSGHAIFFSELIGEPTLKEFVITESDRIFNSIEPVSGLSIFERFIKIFELENKTIDLHSRGIIRTSWQQRMARYIQRSGLIKEEYTDKFYYEKKVVHDSPLIRAFSYDTHFSVNFAELYVRLYLNTKVDDDKKYRSRRGWEEKYLANLESGEVNE